MRNAENLPRHELIGLRMKVAGSADAKQKGMKGKVVDETKNMLVVEQDDGRVVKIAKNGRLFSFSVGGKAVGVRGDDIAFDPAERVKKCADVKVKVVGKGKKRM